MKLADWFIGNVWRNPVLWVLLGALLFSIYGNFENRRQLTKVCKYIGDMTAGPAPGAFRPTKEAARKRREADEVEKICGSRLAGLSQPLSLLTDRPVNRGLG
jgi:hypothetical protein